MTGETPIPQTPIPQAFQPLVAEIVRAVRERLQGVVEYNGNVLGLGECETLKEMKTIRVAALTVVTPAARDWLKTHGVQIEYAGLTGSRSARTVGILVADADGLRRCAFVSNQLGQRGVSIRGLGLADLFQACKEHASLGFVLTGQPQRIVAECFHTGLSAVQISGRDHLAELEEMLRPSVWVVDMRDQTLPSVTNRIHTCIRNRNQATTGVRG